MERFKPKTDIPPAHVPLFRLTFRLIYADRLDSEEFNRLTSGSLPALAAHFIDVLSRIHTKRTFRRPS